ncbi:MAG: TetR/AcrR family transcriptional regulator [Sphingomonadales bacterium]|jgi:AcrR family transcriptional regulator|nr:TetR/AcrR family transcriptional regulator [Sphingomonadales bacterium]MBK9002805.1 TetR/AcrR family transcriptional regulator [Sphingomonadales bacterium]MBK9268030.1 TetR/AcrR family transcriptional regulator [Sphingomonadales bacterium]MBP6433318.1 TetR/AcrR family transcriptional regulator [Sphingorhabdus sp.]
MALSDELRAARCRNLVDAAHALIRETGGTGFSMVQLAEKAGVSPATPYNLLGSKGEVLRRVIRDEFESFGKRLAAEPERAPLDHLLHAVDLVAIHYGAEPDFYRGLFNAVLGAQATPSRAMMQEEGVLLWGHLVREALASGELESLLAEDVLTGLVLRTIGSTVEAWLVEDWPHERFARELSMAVRLMLLGLVSKERFSAIRHEVQALA